MTSLELPQPLSRRAARADPPRAKRGLRVTAGAVMLALAAMLIVFNDQVRHIEAVVMSAMFSPFAGGSTSAANDVFFVHGPDGWMGFRITAECTTVVLIVPVLILAAVLIALPKRTAWSRWWLSLAVGVVAMFITNAIRVSIIGIATLHLGMPGYEWSHIVIGSAFAFVGYVGTAILMLKLIGTKRRRR